MKKALALCCVLAALTVSATEIRVSVTNLVDGAQVEYNWILDADFAKATAVIKGITPNLYGSQTLPDVFVGTGPSGSIVLTVTELADGAFANHRSLLTVTLPNTLIRIGRACFENCTSLSSVNIPFGVRAIGARAFLNTAVTSITLPDSIINLEGNIAAGALFDLGSALADSSHFVVSSDGAVYNRDQTKLYACPTRTEGTVTLPTSLTTIGDDAFFGCFRLTDLTIPRTVTVLGSECFNVTGIWQNLGTSAPEASPKLKRIVFNSPMPPSASTDAFTGVPSSTTIYAPAGSWHSPWLGRTISLTDPSSAQPGTSTDEDGHTWRYSIRNGYAHLEAVNGTPAIDPTTAGELTLPETLDGYVVRSLGENAFANCSQLTKITLPASLAEVAGTAFNGCSALSEIAVADGSACFKTAYGCLYSADGTKLVRVPSQLILPYAIVRTTTSVQVTTTVHPQIAASGTDATQKKVVTSKPVTKSESTDGEGSYPFATLLNGVRLICNYAFHGCNISEEQSSSVTNAVSSSTGFDSTGVFVQQTSEIIATREKVETVLNLPKSVSYEPNAFTGSGITLKTNASTDVTEETGTSSVSGNLEPTTAYIGWIERDGTIVGTVTLTTGALKKGAYKVTGSAVLIGSRTQSVKSEAMLRALGDVQLYPNLAKAKNKSERTAFDAFTGKAWTLAFSSRTSDIATMNGYSVLSVTIGRAGKATAQGYAADGTALKTTGQLLFADGRYLLPLALPAYSNNGGLALLLELGSDGTITLSDISPYRLAGRTTDDLYLFLEDAGIVSGKLGGTLTVDVSLANDGYEADTSAKGFKARLTTKTGLFTGTLSVTDERGKRKSLPVKGALVNGIGYGSALLKNTASFPLTIGP